MAPSKKSKVVTVKNIEFSSPPSKSKLTINRRAGFRRGLNQMLAHDAIIDEPLEGYTPYQRMVLERVERDKTTEKPFEAFAKAHRYQIRTRGKVLPTGLTQDEWEELTSVPLINSVLAMRPDPRIGVLLAKCSAEERVDYVTLLSKRDEEFKKTGGLLVEDFIRVTKEKKAEAKAAAELSAPVWQQIGPAQQKQ